MNDRVASYIQKRLIKKKKKKETIQSFLKIFFMRGKYIDTQILLACLSGRGKKRLNK